MKTFRTVFAVVLIATLIVAVFTPATALAAGGSPVQKGSYSYDYYWAPCWHYYGSTYWQFLSFDKKNYVSHYRAWGFWVEDNVCTGEHYKSEFKTVTHFRIGAKGTGTNYTYSSKGSNGSTFRQTFVYNNGEIKVDTVRINGIKIR